jgi:hypothetical protein
MLHVIKRRERNRSAILPLAAQKRSLLEFTVKCFEIDETRSQAIFIRRFITGYLQTLHF